MKNTILKALTLITITFAIGGIIYENVSYPDENITYIDEYETVFAEESSEAATENPASKYEITHVYEDGCFDVMEPVDGNVKFYCESAFE